ncbi:MAG: hypothetical protein H6525_09195 [Actinobacteria bacterium]|nr:hypothetical protein [Actinomycetota bacterium]MCB9413003.1 hypothetical protein [Actinomycetota bacterium]
MDVSEKVARSHLDAGSLELLAALPGKRWQFVTGEPLAERPGSLAAFDEVIVALEGIALAVKSALRVLNFEGFEDDYPRLDVVPATAPAVDRARKSGRLSYLNRGAVVSRVYIVRERLSQLCNGEVQWTYSTDIGVVFELSGVAVAVVKASHHVEALQVSFGASVQELDLPDRTIEWNWDNEIGQEYRTSREFIDILDCLNGSLDDERHDR